MDRFRSDDVAAEGSRIQVVHCMNSTLDEHPLSKLTRARRVVLLSTYFRLLKLTVIRQRVDDRKCSVGSESSSKPNDPLLLT
jgi:hypothetical protein